MSGGRHGGLYRPATKDGRRLSRGDSHSFHQPHGIKAFIESPFLFLYGRLPPPLFLCHVTTASVHPQLPRVARVCRPGGGGDRREVSVKQLASSARISALGEAQRSRYRCGTRSELWVWNARTEFTVRIGSSSGFRGRTDAAVSTSSQA